MRVRKRPIEVEAAQWPGHKNRTADRTLEAWEADAGRFLFDFGMFSIDEDLAIWNTEEDCWVRCHPGWWIIRGIEGEVYPCSPKVFEATYEPVTEGSVPSAYASQTAGGGPSHSRHDLNTVNTPSTDARLEQ